ncbi:uncharacterized protein LOC129250572 [Anastrepha obliqua]|uniref:uncharacterized protein LOC129250572 n=1 Tax=Anastrepha obliqua TaxID=95512 RepID=UPI002409F1FB|nr:uncharacterized protein LOC129250572 [Anastrepha obliqua]
MSNTVDLLSSLKICMWIEFTLPAIHEWNEGIEEGNADGDHQQEDESDDHSVSEQLDKIKPTEAVDIFNKALIWAGHEDVDQNDMSVLRRLREKAGIQAHLNIVLSEKRNLYESMLMAVDRLYEL